MGRPALCDRPIKLPSVHEYATPDDLQDLFASDMADLFRLAFLLTLDAEKAEQCLIQTMHECMASTSVIKWWLPVWIRNALIQNAIRVVTGSLARPLRQILQHETVSAIRKAQHSAIDASHESPGILQLSDFDRLVYVICVVERYPARDCATFLGRSRREVRDAQNRASEQVTAFEQEWLRPGGQSALDLCRRRAQREPGLMVHAEVSAPEPLETCNAQLLTFDRIGNEHYDENAYQHICDSTGPCRTLPGL